MILTNSYAAESAPLLSGLSLNVENEDVATCLVLGDECSQVFDEKNKRKIEYSYEDQLIFNRLANVSSEQVKAANGMQTSALSDKTVEMAAKTLGEQTGFAVAIRRNAKLLIEISPVLDEMIDKSFRDLMIHDSHGRMIKPSIISESTANTSVNETGQIFRAASKMYRIKTPARFVTSPPTWRSYLTVDYQKPKLPSAGLLPRNEKQRGIWSEGIKQGYAAGIIHGNLVYEYKLNRIKSDIQGMVRYHILRAYNMVSEPKVANRQRTVVGGGDSMSIDENILTIDIAPQLNSGIDNWKSLPRMPDISDFNIAPDDYRFTNTKRLGD